MRGNFLQIKAVNVYRVNRVIKRTVSRLFLLLANLTQWAISEREYRPGTESRLDFIAAAESLDGVGGCALFVGA